MANGALVTGARPRVFVSYARDDEEPFVRRLVDDLTKRGFELWFDRVSMPSRQLTFLQEIRDAIAGCDRLLLVVGPSAVVSDYVLQEWRSALEMGKPVIPIVCSNGRRENGEPIDGYELIPTELALLHAEDFRNDARYTKHLANLARQLSEPLPPLGRLVAVPTLPLHYLARADRLREVQELLLADLRRPLVVTGAAARLGVVGMGGIGKSVLATALARDLEVRRAFPDGIFWIAVGSQPDLVALQRFLARESGNSTPFDDLQSGLQTLRTHFAERAALIILDDVWQSRDANAFDVFGPRGKLLLTTRDAGLVSTLAGAGYRVELPTKTEALALLANAARKPVQRLPHVAAEIVAECGRLPLALALCGGMIFKGHHWERILGALRESRLHLIADRHAIEEHHRSVWRAMEVSWQALSDDERCRFVELAVFAAGAIPEHAVLTLWSHTADLDEIAGADLLHVFAERSLLQLDRSAVTLHDLLRDFVMCQAGNLAIRHTQLVDAYAKQCRDGWPSGPNDGYFFQHFCEHLAGAERVDELIELLLDLRWLEAKTGKGLVYDLLWDFDRALSAITPGDPRRSLVELVGEAMRRDASFVAAHPATLFQCLWNTCWWYDSPEARWHYEGSDGPWDRPGPKLAALLDKWRRLKETASPGFAWVRALRPPARHLGTAQRNVLTTSTDVIGLAFSPDGTRLVSVEYFEDDHEGLCRMNNVVRIWNVDQGSLDLRIDLAGDVHAVAYAPDGASVAVGTDYGVVVCPVSSETEERPISRHTRVNAVAWSPNGERIAAGTSDGNVHVFDLRSGEETAVLAWHSAAVTSLAYSPDSLRIASASDDGTVVVDSSRLVAGADKVHGIAYSPDGEWLAGAFNGGMVRIWSARDGKERTILRGHTGAVESLAFSPDGARIVTGSADGTIRVWNVRDGAELQRHENDRPVRSVAFSPNGRWIASGSYDELAVWNTAGGERRRAPRGGRGDSFLYSPSGHQVLRHIGDDSVEIWDSATARILFVIDSMAFHKENSVAYSPDGARLLLQSNGCARAFDALTGRVIGSVDVSGWSTAFSWSPDNRRVLIDGDYPRGTWIWDAEEGTELHRFPPDLGEFRFSHDGHWIVAGPMTELVSQRRAWSGVPEPERLDGIRRNLARYPQLRWYVWDARSYSTRDDMATTDAVARMQFDEPCSWSMLTILDAVPDLLLNSESGILWHMSGKPPHNALLHSSWAAPENVEVWYKAVITSIARHPGRFHWTATDLDHFQFFVVEGTPRTWRDE